MPEEFDYYNIKHTAANFMNKTTGDVEYIADSLGITKQVLIERYLRSGNKAEVQEKLEVAYEELISQATKEEERIESCPLKPKFTQEEEMKLEILRKDIDRYQNILRWQKIREAERKLLELRMRYDYRALRRDILLDKYLVTLRPYAKKRRTNWPDERD